MQTAGLTLSWEDVTWEPKRQLMQWIAGARWSSDDPTERRCQQPLRR